MIDDVQVRLGEEIRLDLGNTIPVPIRDYNLLFNRPFLNGRELVGMFVLKQSDILNDAGYLSEETDPTVPEWAKQPNKPTYTAEEVGALSASVIVPTMVSQLANDAHYYVVPAGGIPLRDLAPGIIPDPSLKLDARLKGVPGGVAELDSNGMVPPHQLPSYVDDVKSYTSLSFFPTVGEDDKIYIDKMTNKQYRWSGDPEVGYVPIASSLALGETSHTAYRGDRGKAAYDHALAKGSAFESGLYKFTTNAEGHIVAATPVTKEDITALGIPGAIPSIPTKVSDLQNDSNFLTTETDPTVPEWAKQPNKPTYTAEEVGAYVKPVGGIPASDLADGVIPDVSGFYTKPVNGIPASDLASGVIPDVSGFYTKPVTGIPASDLAAGVIPTVPVTDVQLNGTSVLQNGIANIPMGNASQLGVFKISNNEGIGAYSDGRLSINEASSAQIKAGSTTAKPIVPYNQHISAFYALAKAAGADMAQSSNSVGTYTDAAKQAIQKMLGLDGILGDFESSAIASKAYAIGETFVYNGKRYRATAAIAISDVIAPGTNCELAPISLSDIQINGTSILTNGVANIPLASAIAYGAIKGATTVAAAKSGNSNSTAVVTNHQHESVFFGLSKAAGADLANETVTVGTYPATAKAAILAMLGAVKDVQLNGTTILTDGVANIPVGGTGGLGVVRTHPTNSGNTGIAAMTAAGSEGILYISRATDERIKAAVNAYMPIVPSTQHQSTFFGLAKAANADMASLSDVTVGTYPQAQKTAIQTMLGIEADIPLVETVTGATASITGMPNVRYICDTAISELTITPPASGSIVVRFTAGSNCIVVLPQTVKLPVWFDISSLEDGTTYEIIITDGVYGGVMSWA